MRSMLEMPPGRPSWAGLFCRGNATAMAAVLGHEKDAILIDEH
jgi:hypothetical protein